MLSRLLSCLDIKTLSLLKRFTSPRYTELIESIRLRKYIATTDFEKLNIPDRCMEITKGEFDYPLFQMSFLWNMICNSIFCLSYGYRPVIKFCESEEGKNLWEQFLLQPFSSEESQETSYACDILSEERVPIYLSNFPTEEDVSIYSKIVKAFVVLNPKTQKYIQQEISTVLDGKRVVGVLCRGTDYTANKPKHHPVQPEVKDVVAKVDEVLKQYSCDYIYVATEEKTIVEQFEKHFPGKILTNSRKYYDAFYEMRKKDKENIRISWVHHDRENDNYWKSLEYLSSLYILSKCNCLVAGNTGGSRMALYLNDLQYEYWELINLGEY